MIYTLSKSDCIETVSEDWADFAQQNEANESIWTNISGKSIWPSISDFETKSVYKQLFRKVRDTQKPIEVEFRCDGPRIKRCMKLEIIPTGNGSLKICSHLLSSQETDYNPILAINSVEGEEKITCCSICRRVLGENNTWLDIELAIRALGLFHKHFSFTREETICPHCEQISNGCRYILSSSKSWDSRKESTLVLFLHGGRQANYLFRLEAPPRLINEIDSNHQFIILSPITSDLEWDIDELISILNEVESYHAISNRRYVTGISLGAIAAVQLTIRLKDYFAAVVPISGAILLGESALSLRHTPMWFFYNQQDPVLPIGEFNYMLNEVVQAGGSPLVTIYTEFRNHDAWTRAYHDKNLWKWMLGQEDKESNSL
jgi:predicted esterase